MRRVLVAPFFFLDSEMYEVALDALLKRIPHLAHLFTWEMFVRIASWRLVPNIHYPDAEPYKAECRLFTARMPGQALTLSIWNSPARNHQGKLLVHSHSGVVHREVLLGEYMEDRYESTEGRIREVLGCRYEIGEVSTLEPSVFHAVTGIFVPHRTMTLAESKVGEGGLLEYLDVESGAILPTRPDEAVDDFKELLDYWNPHLRR